MSYMMTFLVFLLQGDVKQSKKLTKTMKIEEKTFPYLLKGLINFNKIFGENVTHICLHLLSRKRTFWETMLESFNWPRLALLGFLSYSELSNDYFHWGELTISKSYLPSSSPKSKCGNCLWSSYNQILNCDVN